MNKRKKLASDLLAGAKEASSEGKEDLAVKMFYVATEIYGLSGATTSKTAKIETIKKKLRGIKDIPNLKKEVADGNVTYRGLGMGKLSSEFEELTGESGVKIKLNKKEYYMTKPDFEKLGGVKNIKFDAPHRG